MKKLSVLTLLIVLAASIFIAVAQTPSEQGITIFVDPGHGGVDGGASIGEVKESTLTLQIAKKMKEVFEENGVHVLLTRETEDDLSEDEFIKKEDMIKRVNMINTSTACLAISIHMNKFNIEKYRGAQVFYSQTNELSKLLAERMQFNLKAYLKNTDRQIVKRDNIFLLNKVTRPCCIVECGFMSNQQELALLQSEEYQYKLAHSLFYGVEDYLKLY